jgi:hypothetical protein
MSEQQTRGKDFEERLLDRLKAVVAERGAAAAGSAEAPPVTARHRWRRPARLALVGAAALAVAAAVLVFNSGGDNPSKAFAVEPQEGGGVTIKVYSLEDASGLEKALGEAGIKSQVTWLPPGVTCREPHFKPSTAKSSLGGGVGGMTMSGPAPAISIGVMSPRQYRRHWRELRRGEISEAEYRETTPNISLDPARFRPDQSVVLFGSPIPHAGDPEGGFLAHFAIAEGPVEPCRPVTSPAANISAIGIPQSADRASGGEGRPAVAEATGAPAETPPAPGQFLYVKTKVVELQGWDPDGPGTGSRKKPRYFTQNVLGPDGKAMPALVPTAKEVWIAPDGRTRVRETLGRIRFLSSADQSRWEDAGSPPPFAYDPSEHHVRRDGSGRLVKDYRSHFWRGRHVFSNLTTLSRLPTEPEALRLAIENRPAGSAPVPASPAGSRRGGVTAERLMEILTEPITSPALRAAALNALAELPGIGLEHGVADAAGRRGDALTWDREGGFGREIIFDPRTSALLAQAEAVFGPPSTSRYGVPAGTPFRETAYLRSGVVGSTHETATEAGGH